MTICEIESKARLIGEFESRMDKAGILPGDPRRKLKMVLSYPDRTYWEDADGNVWEQYVPTFD